jgi:AraC-like DNA-binding protein
MAEKRTKTLKPAVLFGKATVKRIGFIDEYIFACEIKGGDHIVYPKARRPKYHLVIVVIEGEIDIIINGEHVSFGKDSYINLPTWAEISEIKYGEDFHAMITATDRSVIDDIFRNRNPFPPDFRFNLAHSLGGQITDKKDIRTLLNDISNLIDSLSVKKHRFAEEVNYAYFYILLTDMANMMWKKYGKGTPSHHSEMKRSDSILKSFAELTTKYIMTEPSIEFYAEQLCISKQYLSLIIKEKTGVTIGRILATMRTDAASRLLRDPELTIQQIAAKLSFADQSSFGKFFKKHTGVSPMKYRHSLRKTLLTQRSGELSSKQDSLRNE